MEKMSIIALEKTHWTLFGSYDDSEAREYAWMVLGDATAEELSYEEIDADLY